MNNEAAMPVSVEVQREDGTTERVRVGYAVRSGDGFVLRLGELRLGGREEPRARPFSGGTSLEDLENLAERARRTLADPKKARWHEDERALLAAVEAELARKRRASAPALQSVPAGP